MGDVVKQILRRPVQLADQITKAADKAVQFRTECVEMKSKTGKLAELLRQAARTNTDLYERPTRRIMDDTEQALEKAMALVGKCRTRSVLRQIFTIIPSGAFRKMIVQLENSISDVTWLVRVSGRSDDDDNDIGYLGLPPIAANEPILCLIWEQIANLSSESIDERSDAVASLVSLARDNKRYGRLIIEEGGVGPLLKLAKEGKMEGQENAARAIGLLGRDQESVEQIMNAGVCSVFAKVLKDGPRGFRWLWLGRCLSLLRIFLNVKTISLITTLSGLFYRIQRDATLAGYADAGYLSDQHKVKSQNGYVFTYGGTSISWRSNKQTMTATSSNQAELIALYEAGRECVALRAIITFIQKECGMTPITKGPTVLYEDNSSCVAQMKKGYIKGDRTKHILPKFFSTHELNKPGEINIQQIRSNDNLADMFTKSLNPKKFAELVSRIGMCRLRDTR